MKLPRSRIFLLLGLTVVLMAVFTLRLMRIQITDGASYRQTTDKMTLQSVDIVAPRGEILDRFGRVLATNTVGYSVIIEKAGFGGDVDKENATILALIDIFQKNGVSWDDSLPISASTPWSFGNPDDVKKLRTFFETIDKTIAKKATRLKQLKVDETATAPQMMERMITRYKIAKTYTPQQARTIAGVRYQMEIKGFSISNTYTIAKNVTLDTITQIEERSLPGTEIGELSTRSYPDGTIAPQVIGNVSPLFADDYKKLKGKYALDDVIGKGGVEGTMENYLRGTNGKETVEINKQGVITGRTVTTAPKPGGNVVLTIDSDLQQLLQASLPEAIARVRSDAKGDPKNGATAASGAAVVLNVKTGEVLAMASYPSYDLNNYTQNYKALSTDPLQPLFNRCIQGTFRPGSAFKPCTATAGLMNGVITPSETIDCEGAFTTYAAQNYIGRDDDAWGRINIIKALAVSSNVFFNTVADRMYKDGVYSKFEETAKALGLGQKTGIELPGEAAGAVSGPTYAKAKDYQWYPADAAQSGIGQLYNNYTPLQLAAYIGGIVNGGTRYQVHVVKSVLSNDNSKVVVDNEPKAINDIKIPDLVMQTVKQGMKSVVDNGEGTANSVFAGFNFPLGLGGKTGTAQVAAKGVQYYNGVFVSFAPFDNPEIAVAIVVEHGHNGYQTATVARDVYNYYFVHDQSYTTATTLMNTTAALPPEANSLLQ